ncbi:hypothetical protein DFP86_102267 [Paludibacterium purpuratum]|uniref:Uncharacterized protein n=1 Tax=Paludibacterium purpuratum TaxID=1144873 RepID=A0A4R7BBW6_9NEIS|nr:hypothetical protein DFP86_102267 [Paludibacterium purpuratum]
MGYATELYLFLYCQASGKAALDAAHAAGLFGQDDAA